MSNRANTRVSSGSAPLPEDRQEKANIVIDSLSPAALERFKNVERKIEVALAKRHGDALHALSVERALALSIFNIDVLESVHGGPALSAKSINEAVAQVSEDPIIARNLVFSNASRREALKSEALSKLAPPTKISMARNGTLEKHLESAVDSRLNDLAPL